MHLFRFMKSAAVSAASCVLLLAFLTAAEAQTAHKHNKGHGNGHGKTIELTDPWTRATPPGAKVAGGYITIMNKGEMADRLIGGSATFADRVEIHEMSMAGDVMKMRPLEDGLEIAPGAMTALEPGGYHIMFIGLKEGLTEGEKHSVRLSFKQAGDIEVVFEVAAMGARSNAHEGHMKGEDHMHGHNQMNSEGQMDKKHHGHGG